MSNVSKAQAQQITAAAATTCYRCGGSMTAHLLPCSAQVAYFACLGCGTEIDHDGYCEGCEGQ